MKKTERRENGSEIQWVQYQCKQESVSLPWENKVFFGSGRDAIRKLVEYGQASRGWHHVWVPSYFCQEVVLSLLSTGIKVSVYSDAPDNAEGETFAHELQYGEVLIWVNFFGLRSLASTAYIQQGQGEIIEDHTHDPWSPLAIDSKANWCIASLRKTLPIPDGGVAWSQRGLVIPSDIDATEERRNASLKKFAAMFLKAHYLDGLSIDKDIYLQLAVEGESSIASGSISGMPEWTSSLLKTFPVMYWREQKKINHRALSKALSDVPWLSVLMPLGDDACPFSGILIFDSSDRRRIVRRSLIDAGIYPAILWPLDNPVVDGISKQHIELSERMLSVHCDFRYNTDDMLYVADSIKEFGNC